MAEQQAPATRSGWRRQKRLVAAGLVLALLVGGLGAGAIYLNSIQLPGPPELQQSTTLYYSDGTTVLAQLGAEHRTNLAYEQILEVVRQAAVADDDPEFWTESTSLIARQAVRYAYDLRDPESVRLKVLGWRLEQAYPKEKILELYLNAVPFGRSAFGIEAAARQYFDKSADTSAGPNLRLTTAEAILLIALLRQPEPDPDDPIGSPGYDPIINDTSLRSSRTRWEKIRSAMVARGFLTQADADALVYPSTQPYDARTLRPDYDRPVGLVVNHVLAELTAAAQLPGTPARTWNDIANGGLQITTTLHPTLQHVLEAHADENLKGSVMNGQPTSLQAAAVVVEPGTGRVLGYYGGHDGRGADYAGIYFDDSGSAVGFGAHPPGQTFATYVVAAALKAGISLRSRWDSTSPQTFGPVTVRNNGQCPTPGPTCTLLESTQGGLDTTFYAVGQKVSARKVLELARDAGIQYMWSNPRGRHDLGGDLSRLVPAEFDPALVLGQYPVTVMDQANAMATFAAGGQRSQAHFVRAVTRAGRAVYQEPVPAADGPRVFPAGVSADLTYALSRGAGGAVAGRDSARKPGTWMFGNDPSQVADAWLVGYTTDLAMAVWVGNKKEVQPIRDKTGRTIYGAGLPAQLFQAVMTGAPAELRQTTRPATFPPPVFAGTETP